MTGTAAWLETPRGRALASAERRQLCTVMPHLIGHRVLQLGPWGYRADTLDCDRTLRCVTAAGPVDGAGDVCFDGRSLPVASRCMDVVILPHSHERCPSPRRLLREAERVLCDHGQLVLLGFNPLNPALLARRAVSPGAVHPAARSLYAARRVRDWLELLDFDVVHARRYGAGFPYLPVDGVDCQRPGRWRVPAAVAQAYLLVARKRVLPATPLRRPRRGRVPTAAAGAPAATATCIESDSEVA